MNSSVLMLVMETAEDKTDKIYLALAHEVRRKIIRSLAKSGKLSFSQLLKETETGPGTFGFHLNKLRGLVEREKRLYSLTREGLLAFHILVKSEEIKEEELTPRIINEPRISKYILGFYIGVLVVVTSVLLFYLSEGAPVEAILLLSLVVLLVIYFVTAPFRMRYIITDQEITIKAARLVGGEKRVPFDKIKSVGETLIPLAARLFGATFYGGYYYVPGIGKTFIAMTNFGDGVLIKTEKMSYIITPRNPEKFIDIIEKKRKIGGK